MRRVLLVLCCVLCLMSSLPFSVCASDAYAYPEPQVLEIDLLIQPYRYLKMIHSSEKQKYDAVVSIDGGKAMPIGVQIRGARSLHEGMDSASKRVPMELCFDYADPNGAFRGNPSLKLINCLTPARVLTQLIAMQTFVFLDVPTPNITPAFIRINDTDFGVYLAVEDLNESFAVNRLGGASLYRPLSEKDDPNSTVFYFGLSPMVVKSGNCSEITKQHVDAVNRGENIEEYLDVDEFLRFMACETFILNDDGFIFFDRNFYLADDHGKLKILPWDKDDVFSAFEDLWSFRGFEERCNHLFRTLMENDSYRVRYREYLRRLNDEFLDPDTFLPWLDETIRVLSPYFQRDETIALRSDDVYADLTTGTDLYNTLSGNLLLTFRTIHDQADAQFSDETASFFIPQGATFRNIDEMSADSEDVITGSDHSIIFRVCSGYWRLRRQALLQNDGKAMLAIGIAFALVFVCTLFFVYRPTFKRRRKQ